MIIFDCTDALGDKLPDGCKDCPFVDMNKSQSGDIMWDYDGPEVYDYYCSLTKEDIGRFGYGELEQLATYLKLSTCPLKEVEE